MTRLLRTGEGIGRVTDDDGVELISTDHRDLAEYFADDTTDPATAATLNRRPLADVTPLRPITSPSRVIIIGLNYHAHAAETGAETPTTPLFAVPDGGPGIVTEWNHPITLPADAPTMVDYEGELGLIIGSPARQVVAADAWSHVGGLLVVNDVSARDVQRAAMAGGVPSVGRSKTYPTFKPVGAIVSTPEEIDVDHLDLELTTFVNGEERQRGRLDDLIFGVPEIIEAVTDQIALAPGDLICSGTPGGVGAPKGTFLQPGDVVEVTIDRLGTIRNEVRADDADG